MEHYYILNLFLAVTILSVSCPTEIQGYQGLDVLIRGFNYPWRRFNYLKRLDEKALDGQTLFGDKKNYTKYPIYYRYPVPMKEEYLKSKKSSTIEKRFNNVQHGNGIKVLHGGIPGTVMFLPSAV